LFRAFSSQTTGLLVFAYYVQIFQILAPWYGLWSIYTIIYAATTVLALAAHFRAQFTDPGAVPKPAAVRHDSLFDFSISFFSAFLVFNFLLLPFFSNSFTFGCRKVSMKFR
jgi:hypothetical protein